MIRRLSNVQIAPTVISCHLGIMTFAGILSAMTKTDVIGIYAVMSDNNCAFLCTDFDDKSCKHGYKDDVLAFVGVCRDWNIHYSIECSRSGSGAHVWIFFNDVIPAYKARRLGNAILTEAINREGRMAFDSYDSFFPKPRQNATRRFG